MRPIGFAIHLEHLHPQHVVFEVRTEFPSAFCVPDDDFFPWIANSPLRDGKCTPQSRGNVVSNPIKCRYYSSFTRTHIASSAHCLGSVAVKRSAARPAPEHA